MPTLTSPAAGQTVSERHCIAGALSAAAALDPGKLAIRDEGRVLSHADLGRRIDQVSAAGLTQLNLKVGDAVLLVASNCLEYIEIVAGMAQLGVLTATLTPRLSLREIEAIAADCDAKAVFADQASADLLAELNIPILTIGQGGGHEAWLAAAPANVVLPVVPAHQPVFAPYTSGSTGQPKGVLLSGETRLAMMHGSAEVYGCFAQDDHFLAVSPLCYGGGLLYALATLVAGGSCTISGRFDPEQTMMAMAGGVITGLFLVPTHFHQMLGLPAEVLARHQSSGALRAIISNAAPLNDELRLRILDYWGEGLLHESYGSTEAGVTSNLPPADQRRKKKCVGIPFPGVEMRIVDGEGADVAPGEVGELLISSPYRFNGYLNRPVETAEIARGDWLAIGDLARQDAEGYYYIAGRAKDMIISGGINVYPKEIEDALTALASVSEASVVGFDDPRWGESIGALVVLQPGATVAEREIIAHVRATLAAFKAPRRVLLVDALPRGPMGKVLKVEVRKLVAQGA